MKQRTKIFFLLLTTCVWLLGGMSIAPLQGSNSNPTNAVSGHNIPAGTEIFSISSAPSALPVQVEKVRILSIQLSARQLNRLLSETVFGRPADFCMARTATVSIFRSLCLRLSLPPSDISFPFSAFW
ncbi:MAG: hypothetical protein IJ776_05575 [Paludibacteraceae bacterium]|nr:hypothetical protein [Paludibacteraceae bacterium]